MKILNFSYHELNGHLSNQIKFDSSLNLITGQNGTGKTSVLKSCWYLYSGNIAQLIREIDFTRLELNTELVSICIERLSRTDDPVYKISVDRTDGMNIRHPDLFLPSPLTGTWSEIQPIMWKTGFAASYGHKSLFFPTFRRVEGGFSLNRPRTLRSTGFEDEKENPLTKALRSISDSLSHLENHFICSVSTADVEQLYLARKSLIDSEQKQEYEELAEKISLMIRERRSAAYKNNADAVLERILTNVSDTEAERDKISKPLRLLAEEVSGYFPNRSIRIKNLKVDSNANAAEVNAEHLSAGEKQLLSFLCYATFSDNNVFMVDEPELSLHLDWQRKLVKSLISLNKSNQYFFVTHSPAIYTKYVDHEIDLSTHRN